MGSNPRLAVVYVVASNVGCLAAAATAYHGKFRLFGHAAAAARASK
jgi:hypothetical protein